MALRSGLALARSARSGCDASQAVAVAARRLGLRGCSSAAARAPPCLGGLRPLRPAGPLAAACGVRRFAAEAKEGGAPAAEGRGPRLPSEQESHKPHEEHVRPKELGQEAGELPRGADNVQFTWKSAIFTTFVCGAALWYYDYLLRKRQEELRAIVTQEYIGKPRLGGPFELTDQNGKVVTDKDFRGQYLLIYFGFVHCPDICPQEMEKQTHVTELIDKAVGPVLTPVFISVDPGRDKPELVKEYCEEFHPRIVGLTGTPEQVKQVSRAYRVYYNESLRNSDEDYLIDHSIIHYFVGKNGKFIEFYGKNMTAQEMAAKIRGHIAKDEEKARERKARRGVESADDDEE